MVLVVVVVELVVVVVVEFVCVFWHRWRLISNRKDRFLTNPIFCLNSHMSSTLWVLRSM
jgi:hypothetical protein